MGEKHQKHAKLERSSVGDYHRNEYAIMGTTCSDIQSLALKISTTLSQFKIAYVDTEHKKDDDKPEIALPFDFHHHKESSFKTIGRKVSPDQQRYLLNGLDFTIVNGNHHKATKQILVIDERKDLNKKQDKINDPILILLNNTTRNHIPEFVHKNFGGVPIYNLEDDDWLVCLYEIWSSTIPEMNGLVLAGGKSSRMGTDKGSIDYHGLKQRDFIFDIVSKQCNETYQSMGIDYDAGKDPTSKPYISDKFVGLGVFGALLSAFQQDPNRAWMIVACDLPLVDSDVINFLIKHRNPSKYATAFYNPETDFPDPLLTIWEPRSYPVMLNFLGKGYSCPRKVLINSDIELLKVEDSSFLKNVNTKEDYESVKKVLN